MRDLSILPLVLEDLLFFAGGAFSLVFDDGVFPAKAIKSVRTRSAASEIRTLALRNLRSLQKLLEQQIRFLLITKDEPNHAVLTRTGTR